MAKITPKMARVGAGLTQQEVADALGVHVTTYGKMEKNPDEMTIAEALQFSKIVGLPLQDIFFDENSN